MAVFPRSGGLMFRWDRVEQASGAGRPATSSKWQVQKVYVRRLLQRQVRRPLPSTT